MSKGTPSMGKKASGKSHIVCRRCGRRSYHAKRKECSHCGFHRTSKLRKFAWNAKNVARKRLN